MLLTAVRLTDGTWLAADSHVLDEAPEGHLLRTVEDLAADDPMAVARLVVDHGRNGLNLTGLVPTSPAVDALVAELTGPNHG